MKKGENKRARTSKTEEIVAGEGLGQPREEGVFACSRERLQMRGVSRGRRKELNA